MPDTTNAYEPPDAISESPPRPLIEPSVSPQGTIIPRHIAALLDNFLASVLSILCVKQLPDEWLLAHVVTLVATYLGYYLVFEGLFATTPGKWFNGLEIRDFGGGRCSFRQTLVRTFFRLLEVNPLFLGFLPAAGSILWSRNKQRFGDKVAGTVVVARS